MKTAVETVFLGKERQFNRRFLQMCSHYLVEPTACTPASGWEKGQVENQVGLVRELWARPDHLRSVALRAGPGQKTWSTQERRAVQELGAASVIAPCAAQTARL